VKVSYIIVAFRSSHHVGRLIESILSQENSGEAEIIVIDNSPHESSADIIRARAASATIIQNECNRGFTAAVNQGLSRATGDYVFLLNPDVVLRCDCTAILTAALADVSVGAAAPQLLNADGTIQRSVRNFPHFSTLVYEALGLSRLFSRQQIFGHWRNRFFDHDKKVTVEQPMASALMMRREVIAKVGDWDEEFFVFFSDVDYCRRIRDAGCRILFVPEAKAEHETGGSTRREGTWLVWDSHRGFYRYLCKHELTGVKALLRPFAGLILWLGALLRVIVKKLRGRNF